MLKILRLFSPFVIAFILVSAVCGLVYVTVQQSLRQAANDPQIQIAQDAAAAIKSGKQPNFGSNKMDLATTLATFFAVYDKEGNPIDSTANLNNQLPKPPKGVFDTAAARGEYRVTWQPQSDVRQALVVVPVGNDAGQFVVAGRSLREVETRENQIFQITAAAWIVMLVFSFLGVLVFENHATKSI